MPQDNENLQGTLERITYYNPDNGFCVLRVNDIQVISPMQRGSLGVRALNHDLQQALNPLLNESITRYGATFARGDKLIQLVNNYDKDVFNGDVGRITMIDQENTTLTISFDGREVSYEFDELDD